MLDSTNDTVWFVGVHYVWRRAGLEEGFEGGAKECKETGVNKIDHADKRVQKPMLLP